ncbi:protein angel homolog 2 [Anopheles funestus]|uniref:protein angel homolog 2 n=1 Tax=Anopheles funestus TaxID=62324 RepID=UPI0020C7339D|nr:protein angel homolog 2 [Anopheles funestus]
MKRLHSVFIDHRLLKNFGHHIYGRWRTIDHAPMGSWPIAYSMDHSSRSAPQNNQFTHCLSQNVNYDTYRRWETVPEHGSKGSKYSKSKSTANPCARDGFEFTLMSYNILAQDLLDSHATMYSEHDPQALPWNQRCKRLMAEIDTIKPDILCVQELEENRADSFCRELNQDFGMLYKKRTGSDKTDGCALFYRRDLFDLVTHHKLEFYQPNVSKLNRENVAIIAKLSLKANPRAKLVVSTTHLLYNPNRQDVRLAQVQVLLAELDRLAYSGTMRSGVPRYDPVILCGDFNLQPFTAPYELLSKGYLRYDRLESRSLQPPSTEWHRYGAKVGKYFLPPALGITDKCQHNALRDREQDHGDQIPSSDMTKLHHSNHRSDKSVTNDSEKSLQSPEKSDRQNDFSSGSLSHRFVFNSAYRHLGPDSEKQQYATTFQREWVTVDYLFYTPYRSVAECNRTLPNWNLELLKTYSLPTVQQCCWEIGYIPNKLFGSDHFSLAGRFLLTIPKEDQ